VDLQQGEFVNLEGENKKIQLNTIGATIGGYSNKNAVPEMQDYINGNIIVFASSEAYSTTNAWMAFNDISINDSWQSHTNSNNMPAWLKVDLGESIIVNKYKLHDFNISNSMTEKMLYTWYLQGSNDDQLWV